MLEHFRILGVNMNIKVHFLHSLLDQSPENIRDIGNEQGEQFHHDIKTTEKRYQGRCDIKMMAEYCWNLKRDKPDSGYSKKSKKTQIFPTLKTIFWTFRINNDFLSFIWNLYLFDLTKSNLVKNFLRVFFSVWYWISSDLEAKYFPNKGSMWKEN